MNEYAARNSSVVAWLQAIGYERLKVGLAGYIRWQQEPRHARRERMREMAGLAKRVEALVAELGDAKLSSLQADYDLFTQPEVQAVPTPFGVELNRDLVDDGVVPSVERVSYANLLGGLSALAECAREMRIYLPPERRAAVVVAAEGFVFLRHHFDRPRPSLYDRGPDVAELGEICELAGVPRSPVRLRNALSDALKRFDADPTSISFGFRGVMGQSDMIFVI